jgi:Tol biopolymer transport system component
LAVTTGSIADSDLWVYDLEGRPPLPLVERGNNRAPIWGPDGGRVYFTSDRGGGLWGVYSMAADGSSQEPQLVPTGNLAATPSLTALTLRPPLTWLPDGRLVFAMNDAAGGGADLLAVPPIGSDSPDEILATMYGEDSAVISPDGRWLAYRSTRTGRGEIWVMGLDGTAPVRVSENGGQEPVWSRDGRELYYLEGNRMMAIQVDTGTAFAFRPASVLFDRPFYHVDTTSTAGFAIRSYDVGPDGRFLMIPLLDRAEAGSPAPPSSIVVVQNWMAELRQLVPAN